MKNNFRFYKVFCYIFLIFVFFNCCIVAEQVDFYTNDTDFSRLYEENVEKGNFKEALFFLRLWFANESDFNKRIDILFLIANLYENAENYKEAKNLYRQIIITYPKAFYVKKAKEKLLEINKLV